MRYALALLPLALLLAAPAQPSDGRQLFASRCGGCHALDRDKEGPRLAGVLGRKAGSVPTFQYSDALKKSGIVWNADNLERWLTDTESVVPDNDMSFRVERAEERRAIVDFLKQHFPK